ncbi:MAG: hypothetical protein AB7O97_22840 [Planctomycetota bacterium]
MATTVLPRHCAAALGLLLTACIGANPPAPPVRWFDPAPVGAGPAAAPLVVTAAPFLGREFVVRVSEHELSIDAGLRWVAGPEDLVARTLSTLVPAARFGTGLRVYVERFELVLVGSVRAAATVVLRWERLGAAAGDVGGTATGASEAEDRSPPALAAAMAAALEAVARDLDAALQR